MTAEGAAARGLWEMGLLSQPLCGVQLGPWSLEEGGLEGVYWGGGLWPREWSSFGVPRSDSVVS